MPSAKAPRKPPRKRVRRSPEDARALILDAADRVFSKHLPDAVGLKDVAREAGVSHALVTHYFGTYDALVEAALEHRIVRIREKLVPALFELVAREADAREMLSAYRRAIADAVSNPGALRLGVWAGMSGRAQALDFFTHRMQGLRLLADAMAPRTKAKREDLELALFASFAMTVAWKTAGRAIAGALGRRPSRELDAWFEDGTAAMLDAFLDRSARSSAKTPKG